jgi:hypothetical protein
MNALRSHILDEVAQLDIRSLMALQNLLIMLKKPIETSKKNSGEGAMLARKALMNLSNNLSQTIMDDREDSLIP